MNKHQVSRNEVLGLQEFIVNKTSYHFFFLLRKTLKAEQNRSTKQLHQQNGGYTNLSLVYSDAKLARGDNPNV